jgi:predicted dehydrogenase
MSIIRIGIIGAGKNTCLKHIPGLKAIKDVEIVSVCNSTIESSKRVADEFGIPKIATNWQHIIEDPSIDAIIIGTWPNMHSILTIAALEADKHVLCEARMSTDAKSAHAMLNASQKRPYLVAQLVPARYTFDFDQTVLKLLVDGYIGQLLSIDLKSVENNFIDRESYLTWRQDINKSGYNILSLGIWYESIMRWVGECKSVMAMSEIFTPVRFDVKLNKPVEISIPDHLNVLAKMVCGAHVRMQFSSVIGLTDNNNSVWLYGTDGTLHVDCQNNILSGGKRHQNKLGVLKRNLLIRFAKSKK